MVRRKAKGATPLAVEPVQGHPWTWLWWLLPLATVIVAALWGGQRLQDPALLPLNTVRIDTRLIEVDQDAIRRIILAHADAGFIRMDVTAVRKELEALPWVETASVRRAWPDVLQVSIQEQQAVARWAAGGLLNPRGVRFVPGDERQWGHLPLLRGPDGSERMVMQEYRQMQQMLQPLGLAISHVSMDERRAWSLQVGEALHLGLGRHDTERRLLRFVRVYPRVLEPRLAGIERVDLRYTNGFAIRWREGFEPPASA